MPATAYRAPDGTEHFEVEGMLCATVARSEGDYEVRRYYGPEPNEFDTAITRGYQRAVNLALRHCDVIAGD